MSNFLNGKKIAKNAIFMYIRMIVLMGINLYLGRLILEVLGIEDFGIYNLVGTIIVCFSFLKNALNDAALRYLTYDIGLKSPTERMQELYSTIINCFVMLSIGVVILGELFWIFWGESLTIPCDKFEAASFAYQMSLLTFIFSMMQIPYTASIIAFEKMNAFAQISIFEGLFKLGLVVAIIFIPGDKLELYSIAIALNTLIVLLLYRFYAVWKFKECRYRFVWKKRLLGGIFNFTSWSLLGNFASVAGESGIGLIFNHFCGVVLNAAIGIANQVNQAVMGFVYGYQTAFKPQIVKLYAANEMQSFFKLVRDSSKYSYFLFFLISIPLIVYNQPILSLWLPEVPSFASSFSRIILACSLIDATTGVFFFAIGATAKIRKYEILISISFSLHVVITYVMLYLGLDYTLVFISRIAMRGFVNFIIGLYMLRRLTGFSIGDYFKETIAPILISSTAPVAMIVLLYQTVEYSFLSMTLAVVLFEILSLGFIYIFGLNSSERLKFKETAKRMLFRKKRVKIQNNNECRPNH